MTQIKPHSLVKNWIRAAGYSRHPFHALYAEEDRYLEGNFTLHDGYFQEYDGPASTIILGPRGSGKTANCLKLAEVLRKEPSNLVLVYDARVLWQQEPELKTIDLKRHLHHILRIIVQMLLEEAGTALSQTDERKLRKMDTWLQTYHARANYLRRLECVQHIAQEVGHEHIYLLIDERNDSEREPFKTAELLAPLLDASLFDLEGWSVKLFVPEDLAEAVQELYLDLDERVQVIRLQWTEKRLSELLRALLGEAWQSSRIPLRAEELSRLTVSLSGLDERFISEVMNNDPTPRGLIHLGQILFNHRAQSWKPGESIFIRQEHWIEALKVWHRSLAALEIVKRPSHLIRIRMTFTNCEEKRADVHLSAYGTSKTTTLRLPFNQRDLWAVLWGLQQFALGKWDLSLTPRVKILERLDLLEDALPDTSSRTLSHDLLERVGDRVYESLFEASGLDYFLSREEDRAFELRREGVNDVRLWVELRFDSQASVLSSFPWELLRREEVFLVQTEDFELSRYHFIKDREAELRLHRPLGLLYIAPRATCPELPLDRPRIENAFQPSNLLKIQEVEKPASLEGLTDRAREAKDQMFHFDGHGTFERRCARCGKMAVPWMDTCCGSARLPEPQGYLLFDDEDGKDGISHDASEVLHTLYSFARYGGLQFAFVNACKSSSQGVTPAFGGVTTALVRAGFPAVIGMLTAIADEAAAPFVTEFYSVLHVALASQHLSGRVAARVFLQAVCAARQRMARSESEFSKRSWWIPTLNLRYHSGEEG